MAKRYIGTLFLLSVLSSCALFKTQPKRFVEDDFSTVQEVSGEKVDLYDVTRANYYYVFKDSLVLIQDRRREFEWIKHNFVFQVYSLNNKHILFECLDNSDSREYATAGRIIPQNQNHFLVMDIISNWVSYWDVDSMLEKKYAYEPQKYPSLIRAHVAKIGSKKWVGYNLFYHLEIPSSHKFEFWKEGSDLKEKRDEITASLRFLKPNLYDWRLLVSAPSQNAFVSVSPYFL